MARAKATAAPAVADEVDIVDEPQQLVGDNDIEIVDDTSMYEIDDSQVVAPDAMGVSEMTTTQSFMGGTPLPPEIVDEVQELPTIIVDAPPAKRIVSVVEDIGPVYYGQDLIELKRGVRYRVPEHIYEYLRVRNLIWSVG